MVTEYYNSCSHNSLLANTLSNFLVICTLSQVAIPYSEISSRFVRFRNLRPSRTQTLIRLIFQVPNLGGWNKQSQTIVKDIQHATIASLLNKEHGRKKSLISQWYLVNWTFVLLYHVILINYIFLGETIATYVLKEKEILIVPTSQKSNALSTKKSTIPPTRIKTGHNKQLKPLKLKQFISDSNLFRITSASSEGRKEDRRVIKLRDAWCMHAFHGRKKEPVDRTMPAIISQRRRILFTACQ